MADGRMLKKAISTSRRLADLKTDSARLLYTWIIPHLDIEGRFYADPDLVKGAVVPRLKHFTPKMISECITDMALVELIVLYEHDGDRYFQLRKFEEHQNLRKDRERPSEIPPYSDNSRITPGVLPESDGNTPIEVKLSKDKLREDKSARAREASPPKMKFLDSVFLSAAEHQKLTEVIGQKNLEIGIEQLDYSITVKGGKYKDHYKTILNWNKRGFLKDGGNGDGKRSNAYQTDIRGHEVPDESERINAEWRAAKAAKQAATDKAAGASNGNDAPDI